MTANNGTKAHSDLDWREKVLAKKDDQHRVFLCEYNIVHLEWGRHRLVYCPGDFLGLPIMLSALNKPCDLECTRGEDCPGDHGDGIVHLQYGSVQIPFPRDECRELHILVTEAVERLFDLNNSGHFSNHRWNLQNQLELEK